MRISGDADYGAPPSPPTGTRHAAEARRDCPSSPPGQLCQTYGAARQTYKILMLGPSVPVFDELFLETRAAPNPSRSRPFGGRRRLGLGEAEE